MDKWILNPYEIDFGAGGATLVNTGAPTPYKVENAVYSNGDLKFYVNDNAVYDANGNFVNYIGDQAAMLKEIAVAPAPEQCDAWCLFWLETYPLASLQFHYQEVKVQNGNVVFGSSGTADQGQIFGNEAGIAVSKVLPNSTGERDIYIVNFDAIRKYRLQSDGVFQTATLPLPVGGSAFIAEADLSPDEKFLAWGNNNEVKVYDFVNQQLFSHSLGSFSSNVYGVEFSSDNQYVYICHSESGLLRWEFQVTGSAPQPLQESNGYSNSQLELAKDGYIYAVRNDGVLGIIQGLSVAESPLGISVSSINEAPVGGKYFALPDQIDGESYGGFFGIPSPVIESFDINGETVYEFIDQSHPPLLVYNCAPIFLNSSTSGPVTGYAIHIYSTDPASGQQISGPGFLDATFNFNGTPSTSIDVRCLNDPVNCDLFDAYINPPYNTFAVELQLNGRCETVTRTGQIEVQDAPDPANIGLQVNNTQTGIPCPATHDVSNSCPAGIYSASINLSNSNGNITYYQLVIDEVSCEDGSVTSNIYTGPQVPVSGVSGLTAIALNGLEINGQTGFFADPSWIGRCLKITATVGNDCGASTDFTFLRFDGVYLDDPGNDGRSSLQIPESVIVEGGALSAYPNPFTNQLRVDFIPIEPGPVEVRLLSVRNQQLAALSQNSDGNAIRFDFDNLELIPGIYIVECRNAGQRWVTKVVAK
ncbi:MAG: hypothetical protein Kow0027_17710 [Saprospiraceae bacterium]